MVRLLHVTIFEGIGVAPHKEPYACAELLDITGRPIKKERVKTKVRPRTQQIRCPIYGGLLLQLACSRRGASISGGGKVELVKSCKSTLAAHSATAHSACGTLPAEKMTVQFLTSPPPKLSCTFFSFSCKRRSPLALSLSGARRAQAQAQAQAATPAAVEVPLEGRWAAERPSARKMARRRAGASR